MSLPTNASSLIFPRYLVLDLVCIWRTLPRICIYITVPPPAPAPACSTAAQDTRTLSTGGQLFILLSPLSALIIIYTYLYIDEIVGCSPVWLLGKVAPLPITAAPRCTMRCTSASFNCSDPSPDSGLELEHWNTAQLAKSAIFVQWVYLVKILAHSAPTVQCMSRYKRT